MKLGNLVLRMLSAGTLGLCSCPGDDGGGNETGAVSSSSGGPGTSTSTGSSSGGADTILDGVTFDDSAGESTGTPVPLPEFDCEGADGVITGNVLIQSAADLAQLDGIREVTRNVVIDSTEITTLDALGCIDAVGENLQIFGNASLASVDGLVNLTQIGGSLIFTENDALTDFDGLQRLTKIDGSMIINRNGAMTHISGFDSLVGIEGDVTVRNNPMLLSIDGLKGLMVVNGVLAITANPVLCQSSVNCVGAGIVQPPVPPPEWTTNANDNGC